MAKAIHPSEIRIGVHFAGCWAHAVQPRGRKRPDEPCGQLLIRGNYIEFPVRALVRDPVGFRRELAVILSDEQQVLDAECTGDEVAREITRVALIAVGVLP
jgi:hypothetical protein